MEILQIQKFYKKWHNDILISTDAINSVASVKGAGKSSLAPVTSYSDAVTISAGQDNVGKIILTVLSFMRLKVDHERDYKGGLIFIDEIETSLYPAAQIQLLKFMWLFGEMWHGLWRHEVGVASQGGMTCLLFRSAA